MADNFVQRKGTEKVGVGRGGSPHGYHDRARGHTKNVRALQKLGGHSQIQTTMRYVHSDQDDIIAIAGAVQSSREKRNRKASGVAAILATVGKQENRQAHKM
jgi:integrase